MCNFFFLFYWFMTNFYYFSNKIYWINCDKLLSLLFQSKRLIYSSSKYIHVYDMLSLVLRFSSVSYLFFKWHCDCIFLFYCYLSTMELNYRGLCPSWFAARDSASPLLLWLLRCPILYTYLSLKTFKFPFFIYNLLYHQEPLYLNKF